MKIGWIGLGNMGVPMAMNLLNAGYELFVYNRSKEKAEPLVSLGAEYVDRPSSLFAKSDIVFSMVSDDEAVKAVFTGEGGLLTGDKPQMVGKIAVDMSTVSPSTSRFIAEACQNVGVSFLDAPVSGSVQPAKDGKLIIMVGGHNAPFEIVRPLFEKLGKMTLHLGENGAGSTAKLAINLLLGITGQAVSESILFAGQRGIAPADMLSIITESAVGSPMVKGKSGMMLSNEFPAAFALKHMAKDLRLAHENGANSPLAESAHGTYQAALREGFGEQDFMAIFRFLGDQR